MGLFILFRIFANNTLYLLFRNLDNMCKCFKKIIHRQHFLIYIYYPVILIPFLLVSGCYDKNFDDVIVETEINPTYALPVGSSKLLLKTYLEKIDTSLKEYDDGLLYFLFQKDIYKLKAEEFIEIPDITAPAVSMDFPASPVVPFFDETLSYSRTFENEFEEPGDSAAYIDEILLGSAELSVQVKAEGIAPADIQLDFPKIIRGGSPLTLDISIEKGEPEVNKTIDLEEGDKIYFSNPFKKANSFPVGFGMTVYRDGRNSLNGDISISSSITAIDFKEVTGYLGRFPYLSDMNDISLDIYENLPQEIDKIPDDTKFIEDPQLRLYIDNGFGIPLYVYFPALTFSSDQSGKTVEVSGEMAPKRKENALAIAYPESRGIKKQTLVSLNKDNSNIDEALHLLPDDIKLQTGFYMNKEGYTDKNLVTDSNRMDFSMEFEMPISAKIPSFSLSDTLPFEFQNISDDLSLIEYVEFTFIINNGFPTSANSQIYFADRQYEYIDSLLRPDSRGISSGVLDEQGSVRESSESVIKIRIDQDLIREFENTEYIMFKTEISTGDKGEWVKFYSDYYIELKAGIKAQVTLFGEND